MTRANAIIGAAIGGWLAFDLVAGGVVAGLAGTAQAQDMSVPPVVLAQQTLSGPGTGPADAPISGPGFIEQLNRALERAISQGDGASAGDTIPGHGVPLAAKRNAKAQRGPVVVELFTAQGCASCPPADEMFARFAERDDVIALALHVDYWDYLGWQDPYAQPAFTQRQKGYARAAGSRSIFTPQMVIEGRQSIVGGDEKALDTVVRAEQARPTTVMMSVSGEAGQYQIELSAESPMAQGAVVQIVRYAPHQRMEILRGENAGLVIDYVNVVTAWHAIAEWDGRSAVRLNVRIDGTDPAVVIVQSAISGKHAPLPGPILASAKLD